MVCPALALTFSRQTPAMFWPRSKTYTPGLGSVTALGLISSVTRTGSFICGTRAILGASISWAAAHPVALKPGWSQPAVSLRAS